VLFLCTQIDDSIEFFSFLGLTELSLFSASMEIHENANSFFPPVSCNGFLFYNFFYGICENSNCADANKQHKKQTWSVLGF
jgi:hypothetical protein